MELIKAIKGRRSVRNYLQKDVSWNLISEVLNAGRWAPTSGNLQNFKFIVIRDKKIRNKLSDAGFYQPWMKRAPVHIVVCALIPKIKRVYGVRGEALYAVQNCALVAQNMMLRAYDLGLGTCFVGAFDEEKVRKLLDIDEKARPQAIITLGYPRKPLPRPRREDLATKVFFEKYDEKQRKELGKIPVEKPIHNIFQTLADMLKTEEE